MHLYKFHSLKQRLTIWFISISALPLLISFLVVYYQRRDVIVLQETEKLVAIRDLKVREINSLYDVLVSKTISISNDYKLIQLERLFTQQLPAAILNDSLKSLRKYLAKNIESDKSFTELFIIEPLSGLVVVATNNSIVGDDYTTKDNFTKVLNNKQPYISDIYLNLQTGEPEMMVTTPVFGVRSNQIVAVLAAKIDLHSTLYSLMLDRTGMGKTGETLLVNKEIIAINELRWYPNAPLHLKIKGIPAIKAASGLSGAEITTDYRGETVLAAYAHLDKMGWGFVAKQDMSELNKPVVALLWSLLILYVATMMFVGVAARLIARSIANPIVRMAGITRQLKEGKFEVRNQKTGNDEIGQLALSINDMADTISAQFSIRDAHQSIASILISSVDYQAFWKNLAQEIMFFTNANTCVCFTCNETDNTFKPYFSIGVNSEMLQQFNKQNLEGEIGNVVTTRDIVHLQNLDASKIIVFNTAIGSYRPTEILSFPLVVAENVVAVVSLSKIGNFSDVDKQIIHNVLIVVNAVYGNLLSVDKTKILAQEVMLQNDKLTIQQSLLQEQFNKQQQQQAELITLTQELQQQNIELEMQGKQVEEANRLKTEFLSNMSHELRTPLNSILALSRVILMNDQWLPEEKKYIEIIERNGKSLLQLINSILDLSKIESGKLEFSITKFDINTSIHTITENLAHLATEKGLLLHLDLAENLPLIENDEIQVLQVIRNIISNAIKFTEKGSIRITTKNENNQIVTVFEDTGVGIPQDALRYIFDEFRQADGSSSRRYEGTGLGLAIAKKTIALIGGKITVSSKLGVGSIFTITLPVYWQQKIHATKAMQFTPSPIKAKDKTILVVDDDVKVVRLITEHLEREGYRTVDAYNGKDALELAKSIKPFAITLDIIMPDMNGWDVLQQLKSDTVIQPLHWERSVFLPNRLTTMRYYAR